MNETAHDLHSTRAELKSLIAPRRRSPPDSEFPRSAIMRTVLNPQLRWLWLGGLTALSVLATRRVPPARFNPWLIAISALRAALQRYPRE